MLKAKIAAVPSCVLLPELRLSEFFPTQPGLALFAFVFLRNAVSSPPCRLQLSPVQVKAWQIISNEKVLRLNLTQ